MWKTLTAITITLVVLILVIPLGWGLSGVWWGIVVLLLARVVTLAWRRVAARSPLRLA